MQDTKEELEAEMYPSNPTKKQSVDSLIHASIEIDQKILFEAESIEDSIQKGAANIETIKLSLFRIKSYSEENSKNVREARKIVREMERE